MQWQVCKMYFKNLILVLGLSLSLTLNKLVYFTSLRSFTCKVREMNEMFPKNILSL